MIADRNVDRDVMQVCRNGHVITARLHSEPETGRSHCDRCGAATLHCCQTCGFELPGARIVHGLVSIGRWFAPACCPRCGAALPWGRPRRRRSRALARVETLLRRLPRVIRQLRWRQTERPPFRVENERDLEDLLRALLPLHFEEVYLEGRTPSYSLRKRTDLLLARERLVVAVKHIVAGLGESQLAAQCAEDAAYYRVRGGCKTLVVCVYDPEGLLPRSHEFEALLSEPRSSPDVRCVIGV